MADSITVADLPAGYNAYLGYVDGLYRTYNELRLKFPGVPAVGLTVLGGFAVADGCDIETFDLTPVTGAEWTAGRLRAGAHRPISYASVSNMTSSGGVLPQLTARGIARSQVRLLSAHYGAGEHICGPGTCGLMSVDADGTQWTDQARGNGGSVIDASVLRDDFFSGSPAPVPPPSNWQEQMMRALPTLRQGATGTDVRSVQGLCTARGHSTAIDGIFGPATESAVRGVQAAARVTVDGIVGPVTWEKLMAV
ncbi:MAG TPA: peptidoglycan-binding domain-containing protein [Jatrophihabitantaceae bacterium]|nr:peptidoglycan-binding domain-containing protein [Jatrophihabitantaceae bacterium]